MSGYLNWFKPNRAEAEKLHSEIERLRHSNEERRKTIVTMKKKFAEMESSCQSKDRDKRKIGERLTTVNDELQAAKIQVARMTDERSNQAEEIRRLESKVDLLTGDNKALEEALEHSVGINNRMRQFLITGHTEFIRKIPSEPESETVPPSSDVTSS